MSRKNITLQCTIGTWLHLRLLDPYPPSTLCRMDPCFPFGSSLALFCIWVLCYTTGSSGLLYSFLPLDLCSLTNGHCGFKQVNCKLLSTNLCQQVDEMLLSIIILANTFVYNQIFHQSVKEERCLYCCIWVMNVGVSSGIGFF